MHLRNLEKILLHPENEKTLMLCKSLFKCFPSQQVISLCLFEDYFQQAHLLIFLLQVLTFACLIGKRIVRLRDVPLNLFEKSLSKVVYIKGNIKGNDFF